MNKAISTPIAITIIICAVLVGGLIVWQYLEMPKEVEKIPEEKTPEEVLLEDETTDWKTYKDEKYGFELRYPSENWKQCELRREILFLLTGKNQKCYPGPIDEPSDQIVVSLQPEIFSEYGDYKALKVALEEAMDQPENSFKIKGVELFSVKKIEESIFGDEKALIVSEWYGIGYGEVGIYVFYNQNLFRISSFDVSLDRGLDRNEEINQILSTFRFLE